MGKIIILFFLLSVSNNYFSSHILGGDVSLEQIGPNNYRVKLRFFRYCTGSAGPNSINNAKIYNGATDSLATTFSLNKDSVIIESYKCVTTSSVCKEIFYYSGIVTLPNNTSGYYFSWTVCCRVAPLNISSSTQSWTWTATFPDPNTLGGNSSPVFKRNYKDHYMCINKTTKIDYSCTDINGDSLVYSLITPYNAATNKPFNLSQWNAGYGLTNVINGTCTIDSIGIVTVHPYALGNFVVSVLCEEYRNGNKIGEVNREIELTSFNCNTIFTTYTDTVCGSFRTIGGKIISNSGTYYDTTQTSLGCDSIIKYNITIKYLDTSTTFLNPAIKSNDTSALYQWLDCGNSYAPIIGATGQTYAIIGNGSYAVEVKNNNCIDTSSCFIINNVGEYEKRIVNLIQLYPNPSKGIYNLSLKEEINVVRLYITDIKGRLIKEITPQKALKYEINFNGTSGIYFLNVLTKNTVTTIKLIKK